MSSEAMFVPAPAVIATLSAMGIASYENWERIEKMPSAQFWLLHAGLIAAGAVLLAVFARLFGHRLAPTTDPEAQAA